MEPLVSATVSAFSSTLSSVAPVETIVAAALTSSATHSSLSITAPAPALSLIAHIETSDTPTLNAAGVPANAAVSEPVSTEQSGPITVVSVTSSATLVNATATRSSSVSTSSARRSMDTKSQSCKRLANIEKEPVVTIAKQPSFSALDVPLPSFIPFVEHTAANTERAATPMLPFRAATRVNLRQFSHVESRSPSPMSQRYFRIDSPTINLDSPTHPEPEYADRTQTPLLVTDNNDLDADVVIAEPAGPSHRRLF